MKKREDNSWYAWLWDEIARRFGEDVAQDLRQGCNDRRNERTRERRRAWRAAHPLPPKDSNPAPDGMRWCKDCKRLLPLSDFHRKGGILRDGTERRHTECRICLSARLYRERAAAKEPKPRKERIPKEPKPRKERMDVWAITVADIDNVSLSTWARLPKEVQDRLLAEAYKDPT